MAPHKIDDTRTNLHLILKHESKYLKLGNAFSWDSISSGLEHVLWNNELHLARGYGGNLDEFVKRTPAADL